MYPELSLETLTRDGMREGLYSIKESFYHGGLDAISQSRLKEYAKSPAHYKAALDGADDDHNPVFTEGTAWHLALLEPDKFATDCVVEPEFDRRTKAGKEGYAQWIGDNHGKLVIPSDTKLRIDEGVAIMRRDPELMNFLTGGVPEVCALAKDEETGLWMKGKLDYWLPRVKLILDLKTTSSLEDFERSIIRYLYIVQAPFYVDLVDRIYKQKVAGFAFLAVEKKKPYAYKIFKVTDRSLEAGRQMYRKYLDTHVRCVADNSWPPYESLINTWEPEEWFFRRMQR